MMMSIATLGSQRSSQKTGDRFGLVGLGREARNTYIPLLMARQLLVAGADPTLPADLSFPVFSNLSEMIRHSEINKVVLCTDPRMHFPLLEEALTFRLPILCEKPICCAVTEMQALLKRAHAANVTLQFVENWLRSAHYRALTTAILSDVASTNRKQVFSVTFERPRLDYSSWRDAPSAGGPIWEYGWHAIYLWRTISGVLGRRLKADDVSVLSAVEDEEASSFRCVAGQLTLEFSFKRTDGHRATSLSFECGEYRVVASDRTLTVLTDLQVLSESIVPGETLSSPAARIQWFADYLSDTYVSPENWRNVITCLSVLHQISRLSPTEKRQ